MGEMRDNLFETNLLCHRNDPETSRQAAQKMVEAGNLAKQEQLTLDAIEWYCSWGWKNFTARDVAQCNYQGMTYHQIN